MTDTKSRAAVVAAVLAAAVLGAAGMAVFKPAGAQAQNAAVAAPSQPGRYLIVHSPHAREDIMLIDSATGRTWLALAMTDLAGDPMAWEPVVQLNTDADRKALVDKYGVKAD